MRNFWKIVFCLGLLAVSIGTASAAVTITTVSSPNFYVDNNKLGDYQDNYVGYAIAVTGANYDSVWVKLTASGNVVLGNNEDGQVNLGPMSSGTTKYAYFFCHATANSGTGSETVTAYSGLPSLGVSLGSQSFTLTVSKSISAGANKVNSIVTGPNPPTLGGIVTLTEYGDSGTVGAGDSVALTAAALPSWDAGAYELYDVSMTITNGGTPITFNNSMNIGPLTGAGGGYAATYKFRAVNTTVTPTAVSPIANVASGTQYKYTANPGTDANNNVLAPIAQTTNGLTLVNQSVTCGGVAATATNVTITLSLNNSSPNEAFMDAFVVTLSGSPTNATYVNNSTKTNNVSYANPSISNTSSNQVLTWSGYFSVPGNSTRSLSFQAAIPGVNGGYTNSAYAMIGTNRIDTTLNLGDNAPAICTYTIAPLADVQVTKTGLTNAFAGTNLVYTLTVTNLGPSTASNVVVVDQLPTNVTFVSASSSGFLTNGQVKWTNLVTFTNTQTTNLTVTVTAPLVSGTITNVASATTTTADPASSNNDGSATNARVVTTIATLADVQTTKTGPTNVFAGTNFNYTITVTNIGPSTASGITVTDAIPSGVTFVNASGGGLLTNGIVQWTIPSLTANASSNLTLTVTAPFNSNTLTNVVSSGGNDFDPVPSNNNGTSTNAIVMTTVTPKADLRVTKTGLTNVFAGTNFTYTITLTNTGPSTASGVIVTDALPSSVTFVSASTGFTVTNGLVTWPISTFTNGATTNLTVTVTAPASGTLTNRASAGGGEFDPVTSDNDGTSTNSIVITAITPQADLAVTKTGLTNVFAGTNFTYTITLTNSGPSTASGVIVTDALPSNVTFVTASTGFTFTNGLVTWLVPSFTNAASSNFTVTVTAPASGTLTNRVSTGGTTFDPVPGNNDGTAAGAIVTTTITPQADLQTTKTGPTNVFAGTNFSYTISLTNAGPSTATSLVVTDTLPTGVTFVSATAGYGLTNGILTWPLATFTNGASSNFTVTVTAPASGTLTNRVSSGAQTFDQVPANNDGSAAASIVTTTITPQADLQITKTGPATAFANTNFSYTIALTNAGPSTATSLVVTDTLPAGVTFVSATPGFTFTNGLVTWPLAIMTNGAATNFTVTVTAPANSATLTNVVSGGSSTFDPVSNNNDGSAAGAKVTTTITPVADIQTSKTGPANVFAGTNFTYTVIVTNIGPSTAANLFVTDSLPASVTFVSASGSPTVTSNRVVWQIPSFTNAAATNFTVTVTAPANSATLTNTVSGGSDTLDPVPTNNNGTNAAAIVTTTVTPQADLASAKTGPANVFAGTNFNYNVTLTNLGPSTVTSVVVTDTLPASVTFVSASGGGTFTNGMVTWPIASLTNGAVTNFTITVTAPSSGTITNRVSSGSPIFDAVPGNNNGSAANAIVTTTITPVADLQVTKTGPATAFANTNFSYTITLTNMGPSTAAGIVVTDALPVGVTFVTASTGFTVTNGLVTWPLATMTNGATTNFTVTVTAPANSATLTNVVSAGSSTIDPVSSNNDGSAAGAKVTTTITPVADIQSTKTGPANVFAGTNFTYTIAVTNIGPSTAANLFVTDALPASVTFVSASGSPTVSSNRVVWQIPSFTNAALTNFTVTVTAPANSATLTNVVTSGSDTIDPVPANNNGSSGTAVVTTTVTPQADLQVTKTGPATAFASTNFSYTITLTNMGPSTASAIVITDSLPVGVTFVTASTGFTFTNGLVTWPLATMTNGAVTNFTVTVTAPANSATLTNVVSGGSSTFDPVSNNNDGSAAGAKVTTTITPVADIQTTKTGPANVFAATNFTYTIAVTNIGPSTAANLFVTDALPASVTFVSASGSPTVSSNRVVWQIPSFINAASTNFTVTVTAPANSATLTNIVSGGSDTLDPVPTNNNGSNANAIVTTTVTPQADLATAKTGPANVLAGTNFNYTVTLTNLGPSTVTSVIVTDTLPTSVIFVSASGGGTFTNGLVTWPIASLTNGAVTNFTITVTAPPSGTITNRVSSGSPIFDAVPGNNDGSAANAIVTTTITPVADLQVTKTGPATAFASTNFSYTITLTNMGPSTASGIVVTDALPVGVTFVTATPGFTVTNGLVTWPLATMTNGAATNFTVTVTAPANSATLTNVVSGGSSTIDPVSNNNDGSAAGAKVTTTITPVADIQTTKTGPANVFAATNFTYTIAVTNIGPSTAANLFVTDSLPASVTFVSASGSPTVSSNRVVWQIPTFNGAASTNFTVTVTAPANAATLTNIVSGGSDTIDPVPANNNGSNATAIVTTTVTPQSDLASAKTGPANVLAGTNFNYNITLTNLGPSTVTSVVVTDTLPASVTFVSASGGGTFTNGLVTWPIANLTNGAVTNFTITVTAPPSGTMTNRVSSGSPIFDPNPVNNDGSSANAIVTTTVTPVADLQASKTGPANVFAATNFSYTITLTNSGPSTAAGIVVTDSLPAGVTFVTASASYTFTNGLVTWPLASLTNGGTTNFTVTVTAPANGTLTNRVSAGGTTIDLTPANNDGTAANAIVVTTITPVADLQATKIGPATVFAVTNFSYSITLTNLGPSTASSVVVTDALPAGVTFVSATPGYTITSNVLTWPIASLASGVATNFSITVTAPASGTLTNRALAGSATLDPVSNNNDGTATNSIAVTTVIPVADIQTTKSGPGSMGAGTNIIYTISVTNSGPSTAANLTVLDSLPPGVNVISVSSGGVATTNSVTWSGLSLTNGAATNLTVTITAASGPITNIVSSTSDTIDPVPANNNGTSPSARVVTAIVVGVPVSGFVYNDANQNGFRDTSENGTGLTLYTKIFPSTTPSGPAIQAVAVNAATGAYSFSNIAVGTYIIIVDDNNTLSDVTPNIPSGWTGIESPAQIRNNITVANTALVNQNFGLIQAVTLRGVVFKDTGVSGGTANDGIKNGGETGIGNVIVKLTDASGGTTYSTTTTAGDGSYTLTIPGSVTNGVQLHVVENNITPYRSTGASVGNTGGTYSRTNDVVTFTYAAGTIYTGVDFGDVPENEFLTDGQQAGLPGSIVVYGHSFTAGSAGSVTFSTTKISTPNIPGWSSVIYRDNNCNSQIDASDTIVTGPITVAADEKICLLVKEFIPAGAAFGAQDQVTISANFNYVNATPALSFVQTRVDLTTVGTPTTAGLSLLKEVDKASAAPGEVITYTITYINASSSSLSNIVIFDATPAYTKFFSATNGVMGAGLNSVDIAVPAVGESGSVRWTFSGALTPEGRGNVIYKVTIE